ncbi:hypothetical protein M3194_17275 [Paenibacillus glycanilyticus]|uniref:hypothetical protein n=1 Tax=Paenibacillus glycanilyticus TaxID=126569 RepID=UPI0020405559|nr:hypothetical protein [Paenibacillus glycanilyticus]MCM3629100.1 hypothetical protein [Paenibacillus glycanilyticus]
MSRLLIKHAVGGRTFIDSDTNQQIQFELKTHDNGKLLITVYLTMEMEQEINELLRWKQELNVFIFDKLHDGRLQKTWYYTGDGEPQYNVAERVLRIESSREIRYLPSNYLE